MYTPPLTNSIAVFRALYLLASNRDLLSNSSMILYRPALLFQQVEAYLCWRASGSSLEHAQYHMSTELQTRQY